MRMLRPMRCFAGPHGFVYMFASCVATRQNATFWELHTPAGTMPPNSNSSRFLCGAPSPKVSSSYIQSFGSYHVDKQTNKQTPLKTSNALRYATTLVKDELQYFSLFRVQCSTTPVKNFTSHLPESFHLGVYFKNVLGVPQRPPKQHCLLKIYQKLPLDHATFQYAMCRHLQHLLVYWQILEQSLTLMMFTVCGHSYYMTSVIMSSCESCLIPVNLYLTRKISIKPWLHVK